MWLLLNGTLRVGNFRRSFAVSILSFKAAANQFLFKLLSFLIGKKKSIRVHGLILVFRV